MGSLAYGVWEIVSKFLVEGMFVCFSPRIIDIISGVRRKYRYLDAIFGHNGDITQANRKVVGSNPVINPHLHLHLHK